MTERLADELRDMVDIERRKQKRCNLDITKKELENYVRSRASEGKTHIEISFPFYAYEEVFQLFESWCRGQGFSVDVRLAHPSIQEPDYYGFIESLVKGVSQIRLLKCYGHKDKTAEHVRFHTTLILRW